MIILRPVASGHPPHIRTWKDDFYEAAVTVDPYTQFVPMSTTPEEIIEKTLAADSKTIIWPRSYYEQPMHPYRLLQKAELAGITTIGVHLDSYWNTQHREEEIGRAAWWSCSIVCTPDGDPAHAQKFIERGVNHRWWLPAASYRDFAPATTVYPELPVRPIVFVGQRNYPHKHWTHRSELIDFLSTTYPTQFAWYGPGSPLGEAWGAKLRQVYASSEVIVTDGPITTGTHWVSNRLPVALASGTTVITPRVLGITHGPDAMYPLDTTLSSATDLYDWVQGDFDDLKNLLDHLLALSRPPSNDVALMHTYHHHMWEDRIKQLLSFSS